MCLYRPGLATGEEPTDRVVRPVRTGGTRRLPAWLASFVTHAHAYARTRTRTDTYARTRTHAGTRSRTCTCKRTQWVSIDMSPDSLPKLERWLKRHPPATSSRPVATARRRNRRQLLASPALRALVAATTTIGRFGSPASLLIGQRTRQGTGQGTGEPMLLVARGDHQASSMLNSRGVHAGGHNNHHHDQHAYSLLVSRGGDDAHSRGSHHAGGIADEGKVAWLESQGSGEPWSLERLDKSAGKPSQASGQRASRGKLARRAVGSVWPAVATGDPSPASGQPLSPRKLLAAQPSGEPSQASELPAAQAAGQPSQASGHQVVT